MVATKINIQIKKYKHKLKQKEMKQGNKKRGQ